MAYFGLVPSEHSSGTTVRKGGLTKAGNALARRVLIEGAWTYRMPARVSPKLHERLEGLPKAVRDIAWKAQVRLCNRYRRLAALGKAKAVVTPAIAREVPDGIVHAETDEPARQQIVVDLLYKLSLRAHRVERLQQRGPQQPLGCDRLAAGALLYRRAHELTLGIHSWAALRFMECQPINDSEGTMAPRAAIRTDLHEPGDLRRLARGEAVPRAARRMLAIANAMEGMSHSEAARVVGIERQSLGDAIRRYNAEGLAGLYDCPKPGRPRKLTPVQEDALGAAIAIGPDP